MIFTRTWPRRMTMVVLLGIVGCSTGRTPNWYERSFYLLHEDYHTRAEDEVGRDVDRDATARLIALSKPDVIQIHAKGNPGWTTYPTHIGFTPPGLTGDILGMWRDIARRDGYHWSIYFNIGRDGEIMTRRPEWNRVAADGKPVERALCYHSGVAENYLWPMIEEEIARYQPDGFWFDGSIFTVVRCYCQKCRERFARETGLDAPRRPEAGGWTRYQEMQRQIYREFVHETCRRIHRAAPDCLVAVNWAYSARMPERPDPGISYLTGDVGKDFDDLGLESRVYDGQGLPFDLMTPLYTREERFAPDGSKKLVSTLPLPVRFQQEMAVIIANGGRYFLWDTPTPNGALVPENLEYLGRVVGPFLRKRQPWCLGYSRVPDVSLLHSAAAHYAVTERSGASFPRRGNNAIDGATRTLTRMHLNHEILADWRLQAKDVRSPLLVIENPMTLAPETIQPLCEWVLQGGQLLLTGNGARVDPRLKELVGWGEIQASAVPEKLSWHEDKTPIRFEQQLFRGRHDGAITLRSLRDARGEQQPILTVRIVGKGRAYYVPMALLSLHTQERAIPDALIRTVFEDVLPASERLLTTTAPTHVDVLLRRSGGRFVVHAVNLARDERQKTPTTAPTLSRRTIPPPAPSCSISVRLPTKPRRVHLEPQGVEIQDWVFKDGRVQVQIPEFAVHQMVCLETN